MSQQDSQIQVINSNGLWLATIIRNPFSMNPGIQFITPDSATQQLGAMFRPANYTIKPHCHQKVPRNVDYTTEVLIIKSGQVRVDFYDNSKEYLFSENLEAGDIALLVEGGHGFKFLQDSLVIEVKQGPYVGEADKVRFDPIEDEKVNWRTV